MLNCLEPPRCPKILNVLFNNWGGDPWVVLFQWTYMFYLCVFDIFSLIENIQTSISSNDWSDNSDPTIPVRIAIKAEQKNDDNNHISYYCFNKLFEALRELRRQERRTRSWLGRRCNVERAAFGATFPRVNLLILEEGWEAENPQSPPDIFLRQMDQRKRSPGNCPCCLVPEIQQLPLGVWMNRKQSSPGKLCHSTSNHLDA